MAKLADDRESLKDRGVPRSSKDEGLSCIER